MKKILYFMTLLFGACLMISACDDWTETEVKNPEKLVGSANSEEYYANLRAYKQSEHSVTFGWFGNWTGKGASLENCMAGLPDSVDFVSMWGGWKAPTEAMLQDLRHVQQKKGTKALVVFIVLEMGDQITPEEFNTSREDRHKYWGWIDGDEEAIKASIVKYANAVADTIDKYNYDGFDLDWEPSYAQPFETNKEMAYNGRIAIFLQTLIDRGIGARSGTGRMLVIDGEPEHSEIPPEMGKDINYFLSQAYESSSEGTLNSRLQRVISHYDGVLTPEECANKFVVTENFETYAQQGGVSFTDPWGNKMQSLEGMARWSPTVDGKAVRKGGVGTYHMEYEFNVPGYSGTYPFLRNATRIMNPPIK
ncbi:endoglycosidase [Bacteroides thetaiotaomicron]|uniref:glycoside hydrolase family 18 n=1 Tax=Bacteroides thetaiotaomicron TaxID=818 RepID=UPI001C00B2B0|nr:glycoside hydrolase family 18 [Bacteroides thetaiotaomicron]MBT9900480.1 endoglycosidase [Bacteroides thetaiotaomicron]